MSILTELSNYKGKKGNAANIALAQTLAKNPEQSAIDELAQGLNHKDKKVKHDCLKVLYEIGYIEPGAIAGYVTQFIDLLKVNDNRMVWGAMIALSTITKLQQNLIYSELAVIHNAIQKGSTITIDNGVRILSSLNGFKVFRPEVEPILTDILWNCPIKQLPMYIEISLQCVDFQNSKVFEQLVLNRLPECEKESQTKRLTKSLKAIQKC